MKNYKLTLAYDGSRYLGWEHQRDTDRTIQGKLEEVFRRLQNLPEGAEVEVIGAGRTDAGVHARGMVCNVHLDTELSEEEIRRYANRYLPEDISVNELKICADRFHARYRAVGKIYRYSFYFGERKPVFERKYVSCLPEKPDLGKMREAAEYLVGEMDFTSFCGNPKMKKSCIRRIHSIELRESGSYLRLYFRGTGFLQYQIRIMTGTLLEAGQGKIAPSEIPEILRARDRSRAGFTAEAQGLCLMKVFYD